jgi:hypothetical protein
MLWSNSILASKSFWKARDVVMSDIFEIFKSEDKLLNFRLFFENLNHDDIDTTGPKSGVKFQMFDKEVEYPTHSNQEQTYIVHDTESPVLDQR